MPLETEVTLLVRRQVGLKSINDAWRYLLLKARGLSNEHGIEAHDLMLSDSCLLVTFSLLAT